MPRSFNTYVSAKAVTRLPDTAVPVAHGELTSAPATFSVSLDPHQPAILVETTTPDGNPPVRLRLGLQRLVDSLMAADAADIDRWEPLTETAPGLWANTILTAQARHEPAGSIRISYHRHDRAPIRDWRIGQRLKTQLAGPDWEGLELYPAEDRVVDTCNEYHLFCFPRLPFGFDASERLTQAQLDADPISAGAVQRDDHLSSPDDHPNPTLTYPLRTPQAQ